MKNSIQCLFSILLFIVGTGLNSTAQQDTVVKVISNFKKGRSALQDYRFKEAVQWFNYSLSTDSATAETYSYLGFAHTKLGEWNEATSALEQAIKLDSNYQFAWRQYGLLMEQKEHYLKAEQAYEQLIRLDSTNSYYYKHLGYVQMQKGEVVKALNSYSKALELNDTDVESMIEISRLFNAIKQFEDVDYWLSKADSIDSDNPKVLLLKTKNAYRLKNYKEVVSSAERWLKAREDTLSYVIKLLGVAKFHEGEFETSIDLLEKVFLLEEPSESVHYYLGLAFEALEDRERSEKHFKLAIESGTSNNVSVYFTNLARNYEMQGQHDEAIRAYKAAYQRSKNKLLLYHLARNYDAYYKNKETALLYYEKYLASNDSEHVQFNKYTEHRIEELNEVLHFEIDTLR